VDGGDVTDGFTQGGGTAEQAPGWYPDRVLPNLQKYWDGTGWIAQRRWIGGKWVSEAPPGAPDAAGVGAAATYPGLAIRPSVSTSGSRLATSPTVSAGALGLLLGSVMLIVGSFTPWVTISILGVSYSISGTDSPISELISVNGWITFACGLLLFILACMSMINPEPLFRSAALVIAVVATGFAVYDLIRIIQKISQFSAGRSIDGRAISGLTPDITVGWGLIVTLIGALVVLVFAIGQARSS
jgi:hypothetical protein